MPNVTANIASSLRAIGGSAPVSLFELQTVAGQRYYWADSPLLAPSLLSAFDAQNANAPVRFSAKITVPPSFTFYGTTATPTASTKLENISGDTIRRDGTLIFHEQELWGAVYIYRLWYPALEWSALTVQGTVADANVEDDTIDLSLKGLGNYSEIKAPDCVIGETCQNTFGTLQCGANPLAAPCNNDWGSCIQPNRYKGVISQWSQSMLSVPATSYAQPAPATPIILRRAS